MASLMAILILVLTFYAIWEDNLSVSCIVQFFCLVYLCIFFWVLSP
uniref:Uncharacterized protein n=1 Tax=Arundo donax TaxID=35708 RepID=A0A0A9EP31_ARUDO